MMYFKRKYSLPLKELKEQKMTMVWFKDEENLP